jgi:hypothetical protein
MPRMNVPPWITLVHEACTTRPDVRLRILAGLAAWQGGGTRCRLAPLCPAQVDE